MSDPVEKDESKPEVGMAELAKFLIELSSSPAMMKVKQLSVAARAEGLDEKVHDELFSNLCRLVSTHPEKLAFIREHVSNVIDAAVEFGPQSFEYLGKYVDQFVKAKQP